MMKEAEGRFSCLILVRCFFGSCMPGAYFETQEPSSCIIHLSATLRQKNRPHASFQFEGVAEVGFAVFVLDFYCCLLPSRVDAEDAIVEEVAFCV